MFVNNIAQKRVGKRLEYSPREKGRVDWKNMSCDIFFFFLNKEYCGEDLAFV